MQEDDAPHPSVLKISFIAGIHGVGKTYLAERAASKLRLRHVTASELIRAQGGAEEFTSDKRVGDIALNQQRLIEGVSALRRSGLSALLLDGHFALFDSARNIRLVPQDVFDRISLSAILLIEVPDKLVLDRLTKRGMDISENIIAELRVAEERHATSVADSLGITLRKLYAPSQEEFDHQALDVLSLR